jgi:hypothetical protein
MYTTAVIHLSHIDQLLPSCARNLVGQFLVAKGLPRGFDDVHLVSRAGRARSEVLKAGRAGDLED